jgi:hypothetical protein
LIIGELSDPDNAGLYEAPTDNFNALLQTGVIDLKGDEGSEFQLKFTINPPIQCGAVDAPPVWDANMDLITWLGDQARALAAKWGSGPIR